MGLAACGRWPWLAALVLSLGLVSAGPVEAQNLGTVQSPVLVLDTERLFNDSLAGQRVIESYQTARDKLIASNRQIEADLRAEEQALTEQRPTLSPEAFRDLADAFDAKVRGIRQDNERQALELERRREVAPLQLMRVAEPVLVQIMRDSGALMLVDHRQVLLRVDVIDITDLAIRRIDAAIGDGTMPAPDPFDDDMPAPENVPSDGRDAAPAQPADGMTAE